MKNLWIFIIVMSSIIIADQVTKSLVQTHMNYGESIEIIPNFFSLTYIKNSGAAFGMFASMQTGFLRDVSLLYLPVLVCFFLIYNIFNERNKNFYLGFSFSLILAGAIGNLIDRFGLRYVVDFLDFYIGTHHYPAFNVADSSITIGAIIYAIIAIREERKKKLLKNSK